MTRVAGILLAAGASERFGRPKQRLPWKGKTFLRILIDELAVVCEPLLVALPPRAPDLRAELAGTTAEAVENPRPADGQGSSLALCAKTLGQRPHPWSFVLVSLVDQPLAERELFSALLNAASGGSGWAASDYGSGAWGPPAVFPAFALPALAALAGDRGARSLLEAKRSSGEISWVSFPGGRFDIDTEEDYARLLSELDPASGAGSVGGSPRPGGS